MEPAAIAAPEGPKQALQGVCPQPHGVRDAHLHPLDALYVDEITRPASPLAKQRGCPFNDAPMGPFIRTDANKMTTLPVVHAAGNPRLMRHNAKLASAEGVLAGVGVHPALVFGP